MGHDRERGGATSATADAASERGFDVTTGQADLLVQGGAVVTMNGRREIVQNGSVAIAGNTIVAVGKSEQVRHGHPDAELIDIPGGIITPGLIDAHNHPVDHLLKGLCDDVGQRFRMSQRMFPYEYELSEEEAYIASQGTFAEMLRHGTTCFCDGASVTPDAVAQAALDIGIRGIVARRCIDLTGPHGCPVEGDAETVVGLASETVERWDGVEGGRLRARLDLDLPAAMSDELCTLVRDAATTHGVGIVGHLVGRRPGPSAPGGEHLIWDAPTSTADALATQRNPDVIRYERLGLLGPELLLAHIGWLNEPDVEAFAEAQVRTVHCPSQSFLGGAGRVAHGTIPELVAAGVTVALGTDGAMISRFLDLVRVMYLAACAHKDVRVDPTIMGAHKAFEMATIDGARAIGLEQEIGSLEVGKRADLVVFETDELEWYPGNLSNPVADLVYNASGKAARLVIVDGRVLLDGALIAVDATHLAPELDRAAQSVFSRLGFSITPQWPIV